MIKKTAGSLRRSGPDILLMLFGVFFFAWQMVKLMGVSNTSGIEAYFPVLWSALTAVLIMRGRAWKKCGSWILLAGLVLIGIRALFEDDNSQLVAQRVINNGIWAFGVCYHLGFGLSAQGTKRFLRLLIALWTAVHAAMAATGLVCALYDLQVMNLNGTNFIGLSSGRLQLMIYCTNTASNLVVSILTAMVGLALTKNRVGRGMYFLAMVVMALATSLTGTRTAYITLGLGIGLFAGCMVLHHGKLRDKRWLRAAAAIACVAVIVVAMVAGMLLFGQQFNIIKQAVHAQAEAVDVRGFSNEGSPGGIISWRNLTWKAAFEVLQDYPDFLLYGASVNGEAIALLNSYALYGIRYDHMHSMYLQTLVECGIPGLLLLGWFLVLFARAAWKLLTSPGRPAWVRMLPLLPIAALVAETVECLTLLIYNYPVLPFTMLFMGLTIRAAKDEAFLTE